MVGIKETKEAIAGFLKVAVVAAQKTRDGVQVTDAVELVQEILASEDFKAALVEAVKGAEAIPVELTDLDFQEGLELISVAAAAGPQILAALKG